MLGQFHINRYDGYEKKTRYEFSINIQHMIAIVLRIIMPLSYGINFQLFHDGADAKINLSNKKSV